MYVLFYNMHVFLLMLTYFMDVTCIRCVTRFTGKVRPGILFSITVSVVRTDLYCLLCNNTHALYA